MKNKENNWESDLAINVCIILCFVLNVILTLSLILSAVVTAMLGFSLFSNDNFTNDFKSFNLENMTDEIAQKVLILIVTFLLSSVIIYNSLSKL